MLGFGSESFLQLRCKSHSRVGQPKGCSWPVPPFHGTRIDGSSITALRLITEPRFQRLPTGAYDPMQILDLD